MAIQEIVSAIDAYIARLVEARVRIAALYSVSEKTAKKSIRRKNKKGTLASKVSVSSVAVSKIAVQVIPARAPRQSRRAQKPPHSLSSALGGPIPQGPVIIRSSELNRIRPAVIQSQAALRVEKTAAPQNSLNEIAQEVAKRIASRGGSYQ